MAYLVHAPSNWWSDWNDPVYDHYSSPQSLFSSPSPDSPDSDSLPSMSLSFSPPPSVKEEPDDPASCFIMELSTPQANSTLLSQSLAPPTEVPLRATQASSDMRRMMTVFRLNPFAMHSGGCRGTLPVHQESAHPLESEPMTFEFQLDIEPGILDPDGLDNPDLRSFSPNFDLDESFSVEEQVHETPKSSWSNSDQVQDLGRLDSSTSQPLQTWDFNYPNVDDSFSSIDTNHITSRRHPRLIDSVSQSYQQKAATLPGEHGYTSSDSPGIHYDSTSTNHHRVAVQLESLSYQTHWDQQPSGAMHSAGYHTCSSAASRSPTTGYGDSSSFRRWSSLTDTHAHSTAGQYLI